MSNADIVERALDDILDDELSLVISSSGDLSTPAAFLDDELPVDVVRFVEDPVYLGGQVELQSKVKELLWDIEDPEIREVDLELGKGSGKTLYVSCQIYDPLIGGPVKLKNKPKLVVGLSDKKQLVEAKHEGVQFCGKKSCVRIKTNFGSEIIPATTHPFLTWRGYIQAGDLKVGDKVACAGRLPFINEDPGEFSLTEAKLLGYFPGDGSTGPGHNTDSTHIGVHANVFEIGVRNEVQELYEAIGIPVSLVKEDIREGNATFIKVDQRDYEALPEEWRQTTLGGRSRKISPLLQLLRRAEFTGLTPHTKHIPKPVWRFNKEKLEHFLARLWVTDGHFSLKLGERGYSFDVAYTTVSERLAKELRILLLKLGIRSRLRKRDMLESKSGKRFPAFEVSAAYISDALKICKLPLPEKQKQAQTIIDKFENSDKTRDDSFPIEIWDLIQQEFTQAGGRNERTQYGEKHGSRNCAARDKQGRLRFTTNSCPSRGNILRWANVTGSETLKQWAESDILWEEITEIEDVGELECADIVNSEVGNSFVAETFITHNSEICSISQLYGAYVVSRLKFPHKFFGLSESTLIAAVNVSIGREQAKDIVFQAVRGKIEASPYFQSLNPTILTKEVIFPRNLRIFCGHSGDKAWLGYATIRGVMDEVNYMFDNQNRNVAKQLYDALHGSMKTRFPSSYKLVSVSSVTLPSTWLHARVVKAEKEGTEYVRRIQTMKVEVLQSFSDGRQLIKLQHPVDATEDELRRTLAVDHGKRLISLTPGEKSEGVDLLESTAEVSNGVIIEGI